MMGPDPKPDAVARYLVGGTMEGVLKLDQVPHWEVVLHVRAYVQGDTLQDALRAAVEAVADGNYMAIESKARLMEGAGSIEPYKP